MSVSANHSRSTAKSIKELLTRSSHFRWRSGAGTLRRAQGGDVRLEDIAQQTTRSQGSVSTSYTAPHTASRRRFTKSINAKPRGSHQISTRSSSVCPGPDRLTGPATPTVVHIPCTIADSACLSETADQPMCNTIIMLLCRLCVV